MLPGLRFLFAATLMCTSLLVFGMGAIALLRASHQQFASLPPRPAPEPVFAQAPETTPSLSMLRAEPAPAPPAPAALPADRTASLTSAERRAEPSFPALSFPAPASPSSGVAEPKPPEPAATRSDATPEKASEKIADPPPMPEVMPLAEKPVADAPAVAVAEAPLNADRAPEPAAPETAPAAPSPQFASAPDTGAAPEITGSTSPPEAPLIAANPVIDPPLPQARPDLVALPPLAEPAAKAAAPRPAVRRKLRQVKRVKPKVEKLPAVTSAPTLGSLFGGSSSN